MKIPLRNRIELALIQHLTDGPSDATKSYPAVARIIGLCPQAQKLLDPSGRSWWEHEVRFAKQSGVSHGLIDNSKRNVWKLI